MGSARCAKGAYRAYSMERRPDKRLLRIGRGCWQVLINLPRSISGLRLGLGGCRPDKRSASGETMERPICCAPLNKWAVGSGRIFFVEFPGDLVIIGQPFRSCKMAGDRSQGCLWRC